MTAMSAGVLDALISRACRPAYENVNQWLQTDPDIASQLRDGLRTVREAFEGIDDRAGDADVLLGLMHAKTGEVLDAYRALPDPRGEWECSALGIVRAEIERLMRDGRGRDDGKCAAEPKPSEEADTPRLERLSGSRKRRGGH